jgi:hypothetical protein
MRAREGQFPAGSPAENTGTGRHGETLAYAPGFLVRAMEKGDIQEERGGKKESEPAIFTSQWHGG